MLVQRGDNSRSRSTDATLTSFHKLTLADLFVCLRPVRWFTGVPSPVKNPGAVSMTIFRENCEDIYAGIEFASGSPEAAKFASFLQKEFPDRFKKIRFPGSSGFGVKPVSKEGTERLVEAAITYALKHGSKSVTLVHKGNIMKNTEGAFRDWGYALAASPEFRSKVVTERESWILGNNDKDPHTTAEANAASIEPVRAADGVTTFFFFSDILF